MENSLPHGERQVAWSEKISRERSKRSLANWPVYSNGKGNDDSNDNVNDHDKIMNMKIAMRMINR